MSDLDLDGLAALAQAATPGGWYRNSGLIWGDDNAVVTRMSNLSHADAAFIAACGPDTILALRERVREAEARAADWKHNYSLSFSTDPVEHHMARADAAEARVAELEAFKRRLTEELVASDAERDRLRAGVAALADELDAETNPTDPDASPTEFGSGAHMAWRDSAERVRVLLCSPTADTEGLCKCGHDHKWSSGTILSAQGSVCGRCPCTAFTADTDGSEKP